MRGISVRFKREDGACAQQQLSPNAALGSALAQLEKSRFIDCYDPPEDWAVTFEGDARLLDARATLRENGIADGATLCVTTDLSYTPECVENPGRGGDA